MQKKVSIILKYKHLDTRSAVLGDEPHKWTDELWFGCFTGVQIFKVNGFEFGGDYPILGFARELMAIVHHLKFNKTRSIYSDPEVSQGTIEFDLSGEEVRIIKRDWHKNILCSTTVNLYVLAEAASNYLEEVVSEFSLMVPELKTDPEIQAWLSDFSIKGFNNRL